MKRSLKSTLASLAFGGLMGGIAQSADNPRVTMIIYTSPGVNFFDPLLKGANDAAKQLNVDLDIQYANNDQATENNIIQTAIANKVDGIAAIIWDDNAFNKRRLGNQAVNFHGAIVPYIMLRIPDKILCDQVPVGEIGSGILFIRNYPINAFP